MYEQLELLEDLVERIGEGDFAGNVGRMLEFQLRMRQDIPYSYLKAIHRKNFENMKAELGMNLPYTSVKDRNAKRIVVMSEQMLSLKHAPTRVLLEIIYALQKYMGYEVLLFLCPSDDSACINKYWYQAGGARCSEEIEEGMQQMVYKDITFLGCLFHMYSPDCLQRYRDMLMTIQQWNPLFVWNIGTFHVVSELTRLFVTTISMGMTIECPISEAQILLRLGKLNEEKEEEYSSELSAGQRQIFLENRLPVFVEGRKRTYERAELGLPEDAFLIAVVGNRLDIEIDENFAHVIEMIVSREPLAAFVLIGKAEETKKYFEGELFKNRIFYLGYCEDLAGVYSVMNLYLNPRRIGGGYSGAMALAEGVPVISLPACDVAYHVGEDYIVSDYSKMIERVCCYIENRDYYNVMKQTLQMREEEDVGQQMVRYTNYVITKIGQVLDEELGGVL